MSEAWIEKSLPPGDQADPYDKELREQIVALTREDAQPRVTWSEIGRKIGYGVATLTQWRDHKYRGRVAEIQALLREWLRDRVTVRESGVATVATDISRAIGRALDAAMGGGQFVIITGAAGVGKSRGLGLWLQHHARAISFRCLPWHTGIVALGRDLATAAGIEGGKPGQRWEKIISETRDAERLLVVDDAQELGPRCLQGAVDWHEETGNALALVGLPGLEQRLRRDVRRASRIDGATRLELETPGPLVDHLLKQLAADAAEEADELRGLALEVAQHDGAFRALEKHLKRARYYRLKDPRASWAAAFRGAHAALCGKGAWQFI
jgi:DNA transposition AAA+ family ATPase